MDDPRSRSMLFTLRTSAFTVTAPTVQMHAVIQDQGKLYMYEGDQHGNGNLRKLSDPSESKSLHICDLSAFFDVLYVCLQYKDPDLAEINTDTDIKEAEI
ncbi:MAG: hypothetical protein IJF17_14150 [Thermoguttaceae bacterium]|nr:hypothetical protein [Thermoguttaceae bacterium]